MSRFNNRLNIQVEKKPGKLADLDPDTIPEGSNQELCPKFSLQYLQTHSDYSLSCCNQEQKAAFADKLKDLSQLQWKDIYKAHKHGNGTEKINSASITGAKIPAQFAERKFFIAFRFCAKAPMVGFIEHDTFYVIWFDHDFSLYPH